MKFIKSVISVCLLVCITFSAQVATAETRAGAVTLSPSFGGYIFEGNQDIDNGLAYGVGLGYHFDRNWAVEAVFNYIDTKMDIGSLNVDTYLFHVDGLYHFMPDKRLVPYVATGLGGIIFDPEKADRDQDFSVNYGGGIKYFLFENIAIRGDVRHVITFDDPQSNLLYTAGITFYFGGEKAKKAPVETVKVDKTVIKRKKKVVIIASEPKAEEKIVIASDEPKIIILAFEDVHFDFDQAILKPEAKSILKRNIRLLKENPETQVRIAGYTSASGTEDYNQKLSERRANAVQEYLISEGVITPDRLSTIGYGKTNPAMYEAAPIEIYSPAAKANMRVLFEIVVQ